MCSQYVIRSRLQLWCLKNYKPDSFSKFKADAFANDLIAHIIFHFSLQITAIHEHPSFFPAWGRVYRVLNIIVHLNLSYLLLEKYSWFDNWQKNLLLITQNKVSVNIHDLGRQVNHIFSTKYFGCLNEQGVRIRTDGWCAAFSAWGPKFDSLSVASSNCFPRGGGVLPYISHIGMCRPIG